MDLSYICNQMVRNLHCDICFVNWQGEILQFYGNMPKSAHPLFTDKAFLSELLMRRKRNCPDIFHEHVCIFYGSVSMADGMLIFGPVSIERPTKALNHYMVTAHHIDEKNYSGLSFCELETFGAGILMIFHWLTGEKVSLEELWRENALKPSDITDALENVSAVIFQRQENELPHNPYDKEVREMDSIRQGNVEMLEQTLKETYRGTVGRLAKDPVRQAKNIAICAITLASRAAIEGGMLPEAAFSMVDGYILKVEDMENTVKIAALTYQAECDFARKVAELRENKQATERNELVERTKNYIFQNLHREIIIGDIGSRFGVNSSYLSNLFHKVEGMTIQNYIRREKIRLAENMLRYSAYDVKEIANYLSFCSQSYFGRAFKAQTGLSPVQYRKKFGKFEEKQK